VQDLADQLVAQARVPLRLEVDPDLLRPVELPVLRGSHQRLTDATGWQPEIPISQTLTDLLEDWRTRLAQA
jgi:GDP-4-dehydro-6-deoxy-D-mannose reductase